MNASRIPRAVAGQAASASTRSIVVNQNFPNPAQPHTHITMNLGHGWAAKPVSIAIEGETYPVKEMNMGRSQGGISPVARVRIMTDGMHGATVKLENGAKVQVLLHVYTSFNS